MKRSEINKLILSSIEFFDEMKFRLPPWAYWKPGDWEERQDSCREIIDHMLGWDLTDFGSHDFQHRGLILFTLRNGSFGKGNKPYAEKIMIVDEMQETPMHFHWNKIEDIINRGGGNLVIELYKANEQEGLSGDRFIVRTDGVEKRVHPGDRVVLSPGESICLEQNVYHRFFGEQGAGKVLVGEVSMVNDDSNDNRFLEEVGRFPEIIEDQEPQHLLVSDYPNFL